MEQGEKEGNMKYQSYTLKDFLLSSHLEQMEFLMLVPGALQTAHAKECWSDQFLKFLKTVVYLSRIIFLQTLKCNESGSGRGEKEGKEVEEGEKKGEAEEEEGMEKKGDTPEKKEKGSSSEGPDKKKLGDLSPQQIDAKVLNVLCSMLEEWETAKVLSHYGKRITDASFVSSPLGIVKDKGSTKGKVPKSKVKLLKETPEKTDKKVTLKLEEVKKEAKKWTPCSSQLQRSQSLTSADRELRSLGKVRDEGSAKEKVSKAEGKTLEETPKKADGKETLKLKEETTSCNKQLQRSQSLKLEDLFRSIAGVNEAKKKVPKAEEKYLEESPKKADGKETLKLKEETTCNKQLQRSQSLKFEDLPRSRTEVKESEVSAVKIKKQSEDDVKVSKKTETLLKSREAWTELSELGKAVKDLKVSIEKDREEIAQTSLLRQRPTPVLSSPSPPPRPIVYSSPYYSPVVFSTPSPPPVVVPPAPKVPVATPKPSAPSGYVFVREHYRQGHEVQGHWRGDTWVNGYYRQGHTVSGHYRKK